MGGKLDSRGRVGPPALRRWAILGTLVLGGLLGGCDQALQLNLVVYDPCDPDQTPLAEADHIELDVFSPAEGDRARASWSVDEQEGQLPGIPAFPEAIVSIFGRDGGPGGAPGVIRSAASVGYVDLSGVDGEGLVELNVAIGRVGELMNTTDVGPDPSLACTRLAGERTDHTATLLPDGRVWVVGGAAPVPGGTAAQATWWEETELYEPRTGRFVPGPSLVQVRRGHAATALGDGTVLLTGGEAPIDGSPQPLLVAQIFDASAGELHERFAMEEPRAYHTATLLGDGRVLLAGGVGPGDVASATTHVYDPATRAFTPGPDLNGVGRSHHAAVRVGRLQVALIGGQDGPVLVPTVQFVDVERNETIDGPDLEVPRTRLAAAMVPGSNSFVAVVGGFAASGAAAGADTVELLQVDTSNLVRSDTVPCFDPFTGDRSIRLTEPRGAPAMAALHDGLLVVGGVKTAGVLAEKAEVLVVEDAASCQATTLPTPDALGVPRAGAVLTSLVGGDVLVTGGFTFAGGDRVAVGAGEIYVRPRDEAP